MDVTTVAEARIAEEAGAVAVMALERVPADIRRDGGVARMSDPSMITAIRAAVTIPVMAKARIGHFVEAQILEALGVDYIDESEVRPLPAAPCAVPVRPRSLDGVQITTGHPPPRGHTAVHASCVRAHGAASDCQPVSPVTPGMPPRCPALHSTSAPPGASVALRVQGHVDMCIT